MKKIFHLCLQLWGNRHSQTLLVGMQNNTTSMKKNLAISSKIIYIHVPAVPLLEIYSKMYLQKYYSGLCGGLPRCLLYDIGYGRSYSYEFGSRWLSAEILSTNCLLLRRATSQSTSSDRSIHGYTVQRTTLKPHRAPELSLVLAETFGASPQQFNSFQCPMLHPSKV